VPGFASFPSLSLAISSVPAIRGLAILTLWLLLHLRSASIDQAAAVEAVIAMLPSNRRENYPFQSFIKRQIGGYVMGLRLSGKTALSGRYSPSGPPGVWVHLRFWLTNLCRHARTVGEAQVRPKGFCHHNGLHQHDRARNAFGPYDAGFCVSQAAQEPAMVIGRGHD
jgi:hypothetical protein